MFLSGSRVINRQWRAKRLQKYYRKTGGVFGESAENRKIFDYLYKKETFDMLFSIHHILCKYGKKQQQVCCFSEKEKRSQSGGKP
jgi:hypothetical protein